MQFPNRYPGECRNCHQTVAAQAGLCEKIGGRFTVAHTTCPPAGSVPAPAPIVEPAEGFYIVDSAVVRVYRTRNGHLTTKTLTIPAKGRKGHWVYSGRRSFPQCQPCNELNIDTARVFGLEWGVCARCGAVLDRPESQQAGFGPECARKLGVPHHYGKAAGYSVLLADPVFAEA
jgi:hypothetical protein